jgi:hypothetical protein
METFSTGDEMVPHGYQCEGDNVNEICRQCPGYSENSGGFCLYAGDDTLSSTEQDVEEYTECPFYKHVAITCL